jgi:hypothetical protein
MTPSFSLIICFVILTPYIAMFYWRSRALKAEAKLRATVEPYKVSDDDLLEILDSLDDTGGYLVKGSELKYWIETHVKRAKENS